ncbi:MAG: hypothetical protein A2898_05350 [Candidatus Kerfeldbacteria bacterium RIFCSPLOWO2_01_FULL_48_11]|uniref:Uncharacterized protein n=1 Tax=Candidatus Kerfeldbacteria bacterium RIFCSPLOWO2_01_FULL_48_11 TaxID=1798543 RepID=A0A1G2B2L7_9BACT|nr:MAG: Galactose-1-phosphate uridylyltransferase [Parcubacteria group bacterium GW2011_GWA2_48_9]KKW16701.1 MAG: Galactose-1-phosphate uridylyltransferase [Parcubacteria group bacterium GW2011_GWC2_49_9]OGY82430.1 MAG: hypothetical protein A2898_05350 [Candidatus Kerfeldbacteria bacterium RIFCSPLOWO2_01_FULL_48_11]HCJ52316.1 hypothetical protein [Candidatus Kerfeldbacteria bacterium]HCM67526.1 hypothetical protein [Candidatus Kerfeldbacteria bacterium]
MPQQEKSEVRKDYIHDRFVIIAPKRSQRPHDITHDHETPVKSKDCPFCREVEKPSQPALFQVGPGDRWEIKVIKNIFPVVSWKNPRAYGHQEVIIETPHHNKELADFSVGHIARLFDTYVHRTRELMKDKKIIYILIFKNHGGKAGASLVHAHSQIFATSFLSPHIVDKLTKAQEYRITHGSCYYCDLILKEVRGPRKVYQDDHIVAFTPYASSYNYETWIIPRRHIDNITQMREPEVLSLATTLKSIISEVNRMNLPYNYYLHQAVTDQDEHLYLRICPRRDIWAGVELGSRLIINTVSPEEAAAYFRKKFQSKK